MTRFPPLACVLLAALASVSAPALTVRSLAQAPEAETVDIAAERFTFTPSEVKVAAGTTLTIRLTSDDTDHGFRILGTDIDVQIPKRSRGVATVTFAPPKPGRYTFECSHLCGAGHDFMRGVIVVTDAVKGGGR